MYIMKEKHTCYASIQTVVRSRGHCNYVDSSDIYWFGLVSRSEPQLIRSQFYTLPPLVARWRL